MIYSDPLSSFSLDGDPLGDDTLALSSPDLDAVYTERNMCVSLLAKMARALGLPAGLRDDPEESEEFRTVCYIHLPSGQVSWHIPASERHLFDGLPPYPHAWDGHTTEEKYERVMNPGNLAPLFKFDPDTETISLLSAVEGNASYSPILPATNEE